MPLTRKHYEELAAIVGKAEASYIYSMATNRTLDRTLFNDVRDFCQRDSVLFNAARFSDAVDKHRDAALKARR